MTSVQLSTSTTPLTINDTGSTTYTLTRGGLTMPARRARITYAPPSPDMHGSSALASVFDQSFLTLRVRVTSTSAAALAAAVTALRDAVSQFSFTATTTIAGVSTTWACDTGSMEEVGPVDVMDTLRSQVTYAITLPCFPIGA